MKTNILITLALLLSCSFGFTDFSKEEKKDIENSEKYPACIHMYKIVFKKCVELNEKGEKVDAMRTEQLMKDGKAN